MEPTATSSALAADILAELICRGVRDVVVCPGSRSQALALAAAEAEKLGAVRLHVRVDERSAAFFALGIARETGVPAVVIVTSGTAVANLMPATLEAFHARVPMILLTADRPAELRGTRANQTVQEGRLHGELTMLAQFTQWAENFEAIDEGQVDGRVAQARRLAAEAMGAALGAAPGSAPGPVHFNIAFREPLSGGPALMEQEIARGQTDPPESGSNESGSNEAEPIEAGSIDTESRGADSTGLSAVGGDVTVYEHGADGEYPLAIVVAGADAGAVAADFAHGAGLPLLAEPSSGARYGREAIQHWQRLLQDPDFSSSVERVIVFGHPTLTREIPALMQRAGVETVVVDAAGAEANVDRFNPGRRVGTFAPAASVADGYDPARVKPWLGQWVVADRALRAELTTMHEPDLDAAKAVGYKERNAYARAEVAAMREPISREHLTEAVWLATWPHDRLVVAASRLIRVLNDTAAPRNIHVHANRGLSGIDGTVATALGVAVVSQSQENPARAAGTTRVLIGDLALLHDAGSLLLPAADIAGDGAGDEAGDEGSENADQGVGENAGKSSLGRTELDDKVEGASAAAAVMADTRELRPRIQLFVGVDGGGTIFDTLEAADTADRESFERVMLTPQRVELRALADAYDWQYERVETRGDLDRLLTAPVTGPSIVEIPLAR